MAIEVPIPESDDTQLLKMKEVQAGVFVYAGSFIRPKGGKSTSFRKGKEAESFLKSSGLKKSPLKIDLDNQVILIQGRNKAVLFQSSNILGVIGVLAPILKGLKNSKYSVFSSKKGHLVDKNSMELTSSTYSRVIASVTSNRGVKIGEHTRDIFSEVEMSYVRYLQSKVIEINSLAKREISSLSSKIKFLFKKLHKITSSSKKEIDFVNKKLFQSTQSLSSLKQSVIKSNSQQILNSNSIYEKEVELEKKKRSQDLSDKLARQMGAL